MLREKRSPVGVGDGLLKRHKVVKDLPWAEELAEEIATLRRLIDG